MVVATFQLEAIDLEMAPRVNPDWGHRRSYVGVPIWMWAASQQPLNWGPYSATASAGGHSITAVAQVATVTWDMGDGTTVTCGAGNPYSQAFGVIDSPSCGHRYSQTSLDQPGGTYTVTATSNWRVAWSTTTGASGVIELTTSTSTEVEILELQSVNTSPGIDP